MFTKFVGSFKKNLGSGSPPVHRRRHTHTEDDGDDIAIASAEPEENTPNRNAYTRPHFLNLTKEKEEVLSNHYTRPIVVTDDPNRIPLAAGYAECINGGKSTKNEDEAAVANLFLADQPPNGIIGAADTTKRKSHMDVIEVQYFGVFDGHAGPGAALMAADQLINHLQEKLAQIQEDLFMMRARETLTSSKLSKDSTSLITIDSLVRGALEAAFVAFDEHIARERSSFTITGGCAAIVALVLLDRVYVANAGDCRAVAYMGSEIIELATEFTPETDAQRIQYLAHVRPALTHNMFSENYFLKPLSRKDIGHRVLYRAPQRSGWHYKEVTEDDVLKPPLVAGHGKWARLMGMIGVTRGFGDHGLVVPNTEIHVKPFLSPVPEVRVLNLSSKNVMENDVLVIGCDGLWDMVTNEQVGSAVKSSLDKSKEDKNLDRFTKVAQDLVHMARGDNEGKGWKMKDGQDASFDDITAFVIPLHRCANTTLKKFQHLKVDYV